MQRVDLRDCDGGLEMPQQSMMATNWSASSTHSIDTSACQDHTCWRLQQSIPHTQHSSHTPSDTTLSCCPLHYHLHAAAPRCLRPSRRYSPSSTSSRYSCSATTSPCCAATTWTSRATWPSPSQSQTEANLGLNLNPLRSYNVDQPRKPGMSRSQTEALLQPCSNACLWRLLSAAGAGICSGSSSSCGSRSSSSGSRSSNSNGRSSGKAAAAADHG